MTSDQRAWLWPVLLMATFFTLSGTAQIATPDVDLQISKDKVAHFLVFGLLATSILRVPSLGKRGWRGAVIAALITIAFGGFDEIRQSLTPGRSVELADWIADSLGALTASALYHFVGPYRRILEFRIRLTWRKRKT
ncbi:MAG: VanZ family protein [Opitutales bacterium]